MAGLDQTPGGSSAWNDQLNSLGLLGGIGGDNSLTGQLAALDLGATESTLPGVQGAGNLFASHATSGVDIGGLVGDLGMAGLGDIGMGIGGMPGDLAMRGMADFGTMGGIGGMGSMGAMDMGYGGMGMDPMVMGGMGAMGAMGGIGGMGSMVGDYGLDNPSLMNLAGTMDTSANMGPMF